MLSGPSFPTSFMLCLVSASNYNTDGLQLAVPTCPCGGVTRVELSFASSCLDGLRVTRTVLPLSCHPIFALSHCLHPSSLHGAQAVPGRNRHAVHLQSKPSLPHTSCGAQGINMS